MTGLPILSADTSTGRYRCERQCTTLGWHSRTHASAFGTKSIPPLPPSPWLSSSRRSSGNTKWKPPSIPGASRKPHVMQWTPRLRTFAIQIAPLTWFSKTTLRPSGDQSGSHGSTLFGTAIVVLPIA